MPGLSEPYHYHLINACIAALYIERRPGLPPTNATLPPNSPGYAQIGLAGPPICFLGGDDDINACFLGMTTDGQVILAFRGTIANQADWHQDFQIGPVDWAVNLRPYGQVEGGFAAAVLSLWPAVKLELDKIGLTANTRLWITGHSKGGAMAILAASLVKDTYPQANPQVVTFATPMVSNAQFGVCYRDAGLEDVTLRYVNEFDIVPLFPNYLAFRSMRSADRSAARSLSATQLSQLRAWEYEQRGAMICITYVLSNNRYQFEYGETAAFVYIMSINVAIYENYTPEQYGAAHQQDGGYLHCFGM